MQPRVAVMEIDVDGGYLRRGRTPAVPVQAHLDFFVDDLADAEHRLVQLGATRPKHQPNRGNGLVVLLDPAGHPFCIRTREGVREDLLATDARLRLPGLVSPGDGQPQCSP
jgi:hypothetical protein